MKNHLPCGYENIITHNHTKGKGECQKIQYLSHFSEVKEMRNGYEKGRSGRVVNSNPEHLYGHTVEIFGQMA